MRFQTAANQFADTLWIGLHRRKTRATGQIPNKIPDLPATGSVDLKIYDTPPHVEQRFKNPGATAWTRLHDVDQASASGVVWRDMGQRDLFVEVRQAAHPGLGRRILRDLHTP